MLYDLIRDGFSRETLIAVLLTLPVILIALTMHELAHGYAAYKLGDPTARNLGRLTLNPTKHLDPIGTIMMLVFGFGWARPVPVNMRNFRKPRRDMAITSIAGPLANILLCLVGYFSFRLLVSIWFPGVTALFQGTFAVVGNAGKLVSYVSVYVGGVKSAVLLFCYYFFYLNAALAVFNLIPIPPLDGSRILSVCLPPRLYFKLMRYERVIVILVIAALYFGVLSTPLYYATSTVVWLCEKLIGWLPFL